MDTHQLKQPSQLFTIRVWLEPLGQGQIEMRGQVQHVLSGETRYFRTWTNLVAYLETRLEKGEATSLDAQDHA